MSIVPVTFVPSSFSTNYRHVALTISGSTHTLYLDGSAVAVNLSGGNMLTYGSAIPNIYIGCAGDLSYGFTGIIDDFKIWNRALPPVDISALYYPYFFVYRFINSFTTSIWLDTCIVSNLVLSGSNVTTWKDKTNNGFELSGNTYGGTITYNSTSPTSLSLYNIFNGNKKAYFIQSATSKNFDMLNPIQTWFWVLSFPVGSSDLYSYRIAGVQNYDNVGGIDYLIQGNQFFIYSHGTSPGTGIYYNFTPLSNMKYLFSVSLDASSNNTDNTYAGTITKSIMRLNGNTQTVSSTTANGKYSLKLGPNRVGKSVSLCIGAIGSGFGAGGNEIYQGNFLFNIHEIIGINNQALGIADIRMVVTYLNTKWNLGYTIN